MYKSETSLPCIPTPMSLLDRLSIEFITMSLKLDMASACRLRLVCKGMSESEELYNVAARCKMDSVWCDARDAFNAIYRYCMHTLVDKEFAANWAISTLNAKVRSFITIRIAEMGRNKHTRNAMMERFKMEKCLDIGMVLRVKRSARRNADSRYRNAELYDAFCEAWNASEPIEDMVKQILGC